MAMLVIAGSTASSASAWTLCMETDELKAGFYSMFCGGSQISEGEFILVNSPLIPTANSQLFCAEVTVIGSQTGRYEDNKCTKKLTGGKYITVTPLGQSLKIVEKKPDPVAYTVANDKFTVISGAMILRNSKITIKCEKGEATGETTEKEVQGKKTIDGIKMSKVTYKGCTGEQEKIGCELPGASFSTNELGGSELVELEESSETGVGARLAPTSGNEIAKIEMTCGGKKTTVTITGKAIGQIPGTSFEKTSKESQVAFSAPEGNQQFKETCEPSSKESDACTASEESFLRMNEVKSGFESTLTFTFTTEQDTL